MITQIRKEDIRFRWKRRNSNGKVFYTLHALVRLNHSKAVKIILDEMEFAEDGKIDRKRLEEERLAEHILKNQEKLWTV